MNITIPCKKCGCEMHIEIESNPFLAVETLSKMVICCECYEGMSGRPAEPKQSARKRPGRELVFMPYKDE